MSLCKNFHTLTLNADRADDGGSPEEVTINITKYCFDSDSDPAFSVEDYDTRYDSSFTFIPNTDGAYAVEYVGGVTGTLETQLVLVTFHAEREIGRLAKKNIEELQCGKCVNNEYMFKKSLLTMAQTVFSCERYCESASLLDDIISDDCGNKMKDCGCS